MLKLSEGVASLLALKRIRIDLAPLQHCNFQDFYRAKFASYVLRFFKSLSLSLFLPGSSLSIGSGVGF